MIADKYLWIALEVVVALILMTKLIDGWGKVFPEEDEDTEEEAKCADNSDTLCYVNNQRS